MALYDPFVAPEELIRPDSKVRAPKIRPGNELQAQSGTATSELAPNFIGGGVNADTGNVVPGTLQGVKRGNAPTPYAKPTSMLASV